MHGHDLRTVDRFVLAWAAAIALISFAVGGGRTAAGAIVGGGIGFVNWLVMRAILERASAWNDPKRLALALALKAVGALTAAGAAALFLPVSVLGLAFGISALFLGLATYGLKRMPTASSDTHQGS